MTDKKQAVADDMTAAALVVFGERGGGELPLRTSPEESRGLE